MSNCGCGAENSDSLEQRTLIALLIINGLMFFAEGLLGWLAQSTGLIADALDMLADAFVYGISLYAIGKTLQHKANAAKLSGILQILLGVGVLVEVGRRLLLGSEPQSILMITVAFAALLANLYCLKLIAKHKDSGVHMRASWIFSSNDVIANAGVIVSGGLVWLTDSRLPDLVIGLLLAVIVIRGGLTILQAAKQSLSDAATNTNNCRN